MPITVGGKGPKDCSIAFIGEALGAEEERQGEPFVGRSGQLLSDLMKLTSVIRTQCYITNVVKEKPIGNNIKQFVDISKKYPIETREWHEYLQILKEELSEVTANVIVAVGGIPLYALTGLKAISKRRGSIYESTLLPGRKVIPIIHPSAALRQYDYKYFIMYDLLRVVRQSKFPELRLPERELILEPSYIDSLEYIALCNTKPLVGFDIEIKNEEVSCFSLAYDKESAICIPLVSGTKDYFDPNQEVEIWKATAMMLENPEVMILMQNGIFDFSFIFDKYGICVNNLADTMVAQGITFPTFPKGLDFITSVFSEEPYYKDIGKQSFKDT